MQKVHDSSSPPKVVFELLADHLGSQDEAIRFMRCFAGIVLRIPGMPTVERMAKDHQIARSLNVNPTTSTVRRLASLHSVPMRSIAKSFYKSTGNGLKYVRLKRSCCKRWGPGPGTAGASITV